jgi:hypothetical protein
MATGRKTGGRKKGVPNKRKAALAALVAIEGETPKDFMLRVMRDTSRETTLRLDAAKAVAAYVHPRLANIEHSGKDGGAIVIRHEDALELLK